MMPQAICPICGYPSGSIEHGLGCKPVAVKHDSGKPDFAQLPPTALEAVVKALDFGAKKYGPYNWRNGFKWTRMFSACCRHIFAWLRGEDLDPESGLPHLAHAIASLLFLLEHTLLNFGEDDRYGKKAG